MMDQEHEPRQQRIIYLMGYYNSPSILHLLTFLFVALTLVTCSPSPTTSTEVKVQAALPTPTLEPTFTPLPLPVDKPASNRDGNDQIYVMNADGSGLTQLTFEGINCCPAWSH